MPHEERSTGAHRRPPFWRRGREAADRARERVEALCIDPFHAGPFRLLCELAADHEGAHSATLRWEK